MRGGSLTDVLSIDDTGIVMDAANGSAQINTTGAGAGFVMNTTASGATGAYIAARQSSSSPAANDIVGYFQFQGKDSAGNIETYVSLRGRIDDPTNASEDATFLVYVMSGGTLTEVLSLTGAGDLTIAGALTASGGLGADLALNGYDLDAGSGSAVIKSTGGDVAYIKRVTSATVGPSFRLMLDKSAAGAAGDICAYLIGTGKTDAGGQKDFGYITFDVVDATAGSESSSIGFWTRSGGSIAERITIDNDGLELNGYYIDGWSTQTTVGAAGAASAPPANPTGYVKIKVGGTVYVIPYYNAS
jgi:hypothetical protein